MKGEAGRFAGRMLAGPALVAVLGSAAAYSGHHMSDVRDLLMRAAVMGAAALPLALGLFRPVAGLIAGAPADERRQAALRRLPRRAGLASAVLGVLAVGSYVGEAHGSWAALASQSERLAAAMALHVGVFATYLGLFVYFAVLDQAMSIRRRLWAEARVLIPAAPGRLVTRMTLGFAAVAAAPAVVLLSDPPEALQGVEPAMQQALYMDLAAAAVVACLLVVLLARAVAGQAEVLASAMDRVDAGDVEAQAAIVSDDELGALAGRFNRMVRALAERERMRRTFNRFVPEAVAGALIADEGAIAPQEREASVLYADIEGFTRIAAALAPRDVLRMLNAYFEEVATVIQAHGGVITQFQGDAVLASFNLPAPLPDHARRAVDAALAMVARIAAVALAGEFRLGIRVGVTTGTVVGGTVGGGERLGYTLHGDTVNLAARLEQLNKDLGTRVLIDGWTAERLGGAVPLRDHGAVEIRGFSAPIRVFEPGRGEQGAEAARF